MTNYVPIPDMQLPQAAQMIGNPAIPVQQPFINQNPLINQLCDISGRTRTIQDVFNHHLKLQDKQKEETEKKIKHNFIKWNKKWVKTLVHGMFVQKQKSELDPFLVHLLMINQKNNKLTYQYQKYMKDSNQHQKKSCKQLNQK